LNEDNALKGTILNDKLPEYTHVDETLRVLEAYVDAAEAHGLIAGFVCAGLPVKQNDWLTPILEDYAVEDLQDEAEVLLQIYRMTHDSLKTFDLEFQLLVPEEGAPIQERTRALALWCHGFSTALTLSGIQPNQFKDNEEAKGILNDLQEIAKVDYTAVEVNEESEFSYAELLEHVRMAALYFYDLLSTTIKTGSQASSKHLH
jgi:uncharacterized protein